MLIYHIVATYLDDGDVRRGIPVSASNLLHQQRQPLDTGCPANGLAISGAINVSPMAKAGDIRSATGVVGREYVENRPSPALTHRNSLRAAEVLHQPIIPATSQHSRGATQSLSDKLPDGIPTAAPWTSTKMVSGRHLPQHALAERAAISGS